MTVTYELITTVLGYGIEDQDGNILMEGLSEANAKKISALINASDRLVEEFGEAAEEFDLDYNPHAMPYDKFKEALNNIKQVSA